MAASPAGAMRPAAVRRATRALLLGAHTLRGFRGAKWSRTRSSSTRLAVLSTHPKQSASSIAASYLIPATADRGRRITSQTPRLDP